MIKVIAVVGPTAVGKSDLAVELARRLEERVGRRGEVINADSMQLYRGMDIGTARSPEERRGVAHHLLDVWEVDEPADVASYQDMARERVDELTDQDVLPILVGGSGLYVRAVLDHMNFPGTDPDVRARLETELNEVGPGVLHARLADVDPAAAKAILPGNGRRIVRALEVVELTGEPFTANLPDHSSYYPCLQLGSRPRASNWTGVSTCVWTACGRRGCWRRSASSTRSACARAGPLRARWGTPRPWPSWTGRCRSPRRGPPPHRPPASSRGARSRGSAATRG